MSRPSRPKGRPLPPSPQVLAIVRQGGSSLADASALALAGSDASVEAASRLVEARLGEES